MHLVTWLRVFSLRIDQHVQLIKQFNDSIDEVNGRKEADKGTGECLDEYAAGAPLITEKRRLGKGPANGVARQLVTELLFYFNNV